ncbi:hypothetical protein AC578_6412 [Pseudocercospora eumusae]|uniref:Uncharacterized protein n=1 Tax=Pseudocercospora eumusae TaxID=321146 RepID=A0A139H6S9_9PEZI|nr:hypothetical protein AC578_6412 [Pseudocercospora eumusae]
MDTLLYIRPVRTRCFDSIGRENPAVKGFFIKYIRICLPQQQQTSESSDTKCIDLSSHSRIKGKKKEIQHPSIIMSPSKIPNLKETCQTLDQKISDSRRDNIVVTQSDFPNSLIRELALHLLNEFEESEEKLKKLHKKVEERRGLDWRDGNFKDVAGMDALDDGDLQRYLLDTLVPKIVDMKAEMSLEGVKGTNEEMVRRRNDAAEEEEEEVGVDRDYM